VLRARGEDQRVGHERCQHRDPARIAAQDSFRETNDEVEAAGRLEEREGGDDSQDHPQHRAGWAAWRKAEQEDEHEEAEAAHWPQGHSPPARAEDDRRHQDRELEPQAHRQ
jgi:hypothetical protein